MIISYRFVAYALLVALVFSFLMITSVQAVGETCNSINDEGCIIPVVLGDTINFVAMTSDGGMFLVCRNDFDHCSAGQGFFDSGFQSISIQITSSQINGCTGGPCTHFGFNNWGGGRAQLANGIPAQLPTPTPMPTFTPTPVPLVVLGLFDSFDVGLTIDGIVSEVVGFLLSPSVVGIISAVIALLGIQRVFGWWRR